MTNKSSMQKFREQFIRGIEDSKDKTQFVKNNANDLFSLGLTVYSKNFSLKSLIYNSFATSCLDDNISLHPEQLKVLKLIDKNEGVIFSAPTSFGKTFVVFEHIARQKPNNIVLIVPTLALVDEYNKRIISKYKDIFQDYKVYLSISEDYEYDFNGKNIFILTHDRIVENSNYLTIKEIDFLVIDEVYKLERNEFDDRILILNLAYFHLVKIAKKHVLLAPFISGIKKLDKLDKKPIFYCTEYSPVINEIKVYDIIDSNDRFSKTNEIIAFLPSEEKTMIYFPTVSEIAKYVKHHVNEIDSKYKHHFIDWLKNEIHEDWYLVKAMENGYLVHNGQLPIGIRMYQLYLYDKNKSFNKLICNSALLEGINTSAKNIIIAKASRTGKDKFDAFDFFNLVGCSGRLYEHHLGCAHYIKTPTDIEYLKEDAIRSIEFEVTDESEDMDIHRDDYNENLVYLAFLDELGITHEDYKTKIGNKFRLNTVLNLFSNYKKYKDQVLEEINNLLNNDKRTRFFLINAIYTMIEGSGNKLNSGIINLCIHKKRLRLNEIIKETMKYSRADIDYVINKTIQLKSSYVEHKFYSKLLIILFFMECQSLENKYFDIIDKKIKQPISYLYFTESKPKKMLKDLGVYERDINEIIEMIGDDFKDAFELKKLLSENKNKFTRISFISRFVIHSLIN